MTNSIEFLLERIRVNCKWYFGHDVQVITYYYRPTLTWCVNVYPAHFTQALAFRGSSDMDIHLYGNSKVSLYQALEETQYLIESVIGDLFTITGGSKPQFIKEYDLRCGCQERPASPAVAEYQAKVQDFETRLQALENKSHLGTPQLNHAVTICHPGSPGTEASSAQEIWPMLQKIERTLEAIEHHCPDEKTTPTTPEDAERIDGVIAAVVTQATPCSTSVGTGEQLNTQIPQSAQPPTLRFERTTEIPGPEMVLRSTSRSSMPTSDYDGHFEDFNSETVMTPSASTTERSITARAGPDAAAELNRDLLRKEIDRALARAMLNMAGILAKAENGGV